MYSPIPLSSDIGIHVLHPSFALILILLSRPSTRTLLITAELLALTPLLSLPVTAAPSRHQISGFGTRHYPLCRAPHIFHCCDYNWRVFQFYSCMRPGVRGMPMIDLLLGKHPLIKPCRDYMFPTCCKMHDVVGLGYDCYNATVNNTLSRDGWGGIEIGQELMHEPDIQRWRAEEHKRRKKEEKERKKQQKKKEKERKERQQKKKGVGH